MNFVLLRISLTSHILIISIPFAFLSFLPLGSVPHRWGWHENNEAHHDGHGPAERGGGAVSVYRRGAVRGHSGEQNGGQCAEAVPAQLKRTADDVSLPQRLHCGGEAGHATAADQRRAHTDVPAAQVQLRDAGDCDPALEGGVDEEPQEQDVRVQLGRGVWADAVASGGGDAGLDLGHKVQQRRHRDSD